MLSLVAASILLVSGTPLPRAHAHNDYAQPRPLAGALELGYCSIEVDVFLAGGKLLVGHDRKDLRPERTLDSMYLRPLSEAIKANNGSVYAKPAEVILLVDIKADGAAVYEQLKRELKPYESWLTRYRDGKVEKRALTVILSGERPTSVLAKERSRFAFIDGRPANLNPPSPPATLVALVSTSWQSQFKWNGTGEMPAEERAKLDQMVHDCHVDGQKLRFWATPETPALWRTLYEAGVDLMGTDRQKDLADFLRSRTETLIAVP